MQVPGSEIPNEERYATWAGIGALLGFFVAPQLIGLRALTGAILGGAGGLYLGMEKQKKIDAQRSEAETPWQREHWTGSPPAAAYDSTSSPY